MKVEMVMPQMGESIAEATVLKWRKGVGDSVEKDELILDIATDKVDSEIPAPNAGIIVEILAPEGEVVPVKSVIAIIETDAAAAKDAVANGSSSSTSHAAPQPAAQPAAPSAPAAAPAATPAPVMAAPAAAGGQMVDMVMPQMGESIAEATILKWLRKIGDEVRKDETILEISTDKVDSEIPAPASGVLSEIVAAEGDTVAVKSIIAKISTGASGNGASAAPVQQAAPASQAAPAPQPAPAKPAPAASAVQSSGAPASGLPTRYGEKFFSPLVRSLATQHGVSAVELASIPGSGAHGRVTKNDLMLYLEHRGSAPAPQAAAAAQSAAPSAPAARPAAPQAPAMNYGTDGIIVEEMNNMRKRIAEHMVRSKATSPHVYSVAEIDVTNIARWRKKVQNDFVKREGYKLSFTPFFLEAAVKGLVHNPYINASIDGDKILLKRDINLGCAVALPAPPGKAGGLIVPVIKRADQLSLAGIARSLNDLATRARDKALLPDEIAGGTFTVTNVGTFGNIIGNPIINQPQLAILAIGAIKKRPAVVDDMIAIRDIVYLTLSYDHRLIDGMMAGQFLKFVTDYLQNWDMNRAPF